MIGSPTRLSWPKVAWAAIASLIVVAAAAGADAERVEPAFCTIRQLNAGVCGAGTWRTTAYVVSRSICDPCPGREPCEPCLKDHVVMSEQPQVVSLPNSRMPDLELVVFVPNPRALSIGARYDIVIVVPHAIQFTGKYMDSYQVGVKALDVRPTATTGASAPQAIPAEDQACAQDTDCIRVPMECPDCGCGVVVNLSARQRYLDRHRALCASYHGPMCEPFCLTPAARCINGRCAMTGYP